MAGSRLVLLAAMQASLAYAVFSCSAPVNDSRVHYIATIPPLAMILEEVVGERANVTSLLQPGASPHTYEPRPSDIAAIENAAALFWIDPALDGWAASFGDVERVAVFAMVPDSMRLRMSEPSDSHVSADGHEEGQDPHFWTSPPVVKAILPALVDVLSSLDPDGTEIYSANADEFSRKLDDLHQGVSGMMAPYAGEALLMFHPSFGYFLNEYGLELAGVIEPFPGREPSPAYIVGLMDIVRDLDVKAVFTEPQLPSAPAETIAEETGLSLYVLDPLGGVPGRATYSELILYNAETIVHALSE